LYPPVSPLAVLHDSAIGSFSSSCCEDFYHLNRPAVFQLLVLFLCSEPSEDLQDLVEDKEIAACAVAFVVNGTRRGIVPLCADVASLMRSKRRYHSFLEHAVFK
jgi:hypothetical protein